jgi:hypothetical protein
MQAAIALCSLSTFTNWHFISPDETRVAIFSTIDVWGVMGYAATTSAFETIAPYAEA